MSGSADIRRMIRKIKRIPGMAEREAPACAEAVDGVIRADLAAGRSPDGQAWAPTRKEGRRALPNASDAITTRAVGTTIISAAPFPYSQHQRGNKRMVARPVMPQGMTPKIAAAINATLSRAFQKDMSG